MKLVVQRVKSASVVDIKSNKVVGEIGEGLFVLVGIGKDDTKETIKEYANKLFKLRVMSDNNQKMNLTVNDVDGSFLIVSQFTLLADTKTGNRPSFIAAKEPEEARKLYELFIDNLKSLGGKVETGSFGEYMEINTVLDGPVTILY